jgi:hypothetical protein
MIDALMFQYMPFGFLHFLGGVLWWMFIVTGTLAFMKYLGRQETAPIQQERKPTPEIKPIEKVIKAPEIPKETGLVVTEETPFKKRTPRKNEKIAGL